MDAVTTHSDFGAQENKICHSFHFSYSQLLFAAGFFFFFYSGHKFLKIKLIRTFENIYPLHYSLLNNKGPISYECLIKPSFYYFNFVFLQSVSYFSVSLQ